VSLSKWLVAAALLLGGAAAVGAVVSQADTQDSQRDSDGPLRVPPVHGWSISAAPGERFADGLETLRVTGDKAATIEEISFVGDDGLRFLGAYVVGPDDRNAIVQILHQWPPRRSPTFEASSMKPAIGAEIPASDGRSESSWELLLGVEVVDESQGRLHREGVRIDYRIGSQRFTALFPAELIVCVDENTEPTECTLE